MRKITRGRMINGAIYLLVYCYLLSSFLDNQPSYGRGLARGAAEGIALVLLIIAIATIYYTRKSGGSWGKVRSNLKHNFLAMLDVGWKNK